MNKLSGVLALVLSVLQAMPAQANPVTDDRHTFEFESLSGREIVDGIAGMCSGETWPAFVKWAKNDGFLARSTDQTVRIQWHDRTFEVERGPKVTVTQNNLLQASYAGRLIEGKDPCDLIMKMAAHKTKSAAAFSLLIPTAAADDFISEGRLGDYGMLGLGGAAIVAGLVGALWSPRGGAVFATIGGFLAVGALNRIVTKGEFEHILNDKFSVACDKQTTTITGDDQKIVIHKQPFKVELFDHDGKRRANDTASKAAAKARDFALKLTQQCESSTDADKINLRLSAARSETLHRLQDFAPSTPESSQITR